MKTLLLSLALVIGAAPAVAQSPYYAFEQLTIPNSSTGFTPATIRQGNGHPQAVRAVCRVETAQIRFRVDGTAPTASVGTILNVDDILTLTDPNMIENFRAIRTGSTSGVLDCAYAGQQ